MEQKYDDEIEIDLKELFFVMISKIWVILGTTIVGAMIAILVTTMCITPMYESTSSLYIISKTTTLTSLTDLQMGTQLTQDYMVIAKSRKVIEQVIDELKMSETYEQFLDKVSLYNESNTRVLSIAVKNADPNRAKMIVDKYAEVIATETATIMDTDVPHIIDVGVVASTPISPNMFKNIVIGSLIGFLLSAGLIVLLFLLNDAVQTPEDAEKYLGLTNLGSVPLYESSVKNKKIRHKQKA